jgi:hypothetical protein
MFDHVIPGRNIRMTEWQGAILLAQLERLREQMARRNHSAARLTGALAELPGLAPLRVDDRITRHGWHLYQFQYDPKQFGGRDRADFLAALDAARVTIRCRTSARSRTPFTSGSAKRCCDIRFHTPKPPVTTRSGCRRRCSSPTTKPSIRSSPPSARSPRRGHRGAQVPLNIRPL